MTLKKRLRKLLEANDMAGLLETVRREHGVFRVLISFAYDKEELICWRAIEAIGIAAGDVAENDPGTVRNLVGRLLWTIREESGGIGWSAPEILGEIVRNSPDEFSDIARIIGSFHEEKMLRRGVMRALVRISEVRPDLIYLPPEVIGISLEDEDAGVRLYAIMLAGILGAKQFSDAVKTLREDNTLIRIYRDGQFIELAVGTVAEQTVILKEEERRR